MIHWEHVTGDKTIETDLTWYGTKGLVIQRVGTHTDIIVQRPGKKIGAELWITMTIVGDPNTVRIYGNPVTSLKPQAGSYYEASGAEATAKLIAVDENTWALALNGGFTLI